MKIEIEKATKDYLENKGVSSWPIWEKEISRFDWHYDNTEECYLLESEVVVETEDGKRVEFGEGDFVTFPKGCRVSGIESNPSKSTTISGRIQKPYRVNCACICCSQSKSSKSN